MEALAGLPDQMGPVVKGGPLWPRDGAIVGSWWALREIELSTTRCEQVSFEPGPGCGVCQLLLPVSKSDPQALGKKRVHACSCHGVAATARGRALCPVAAARRLVNRARVHVPAGAEPDEGLRPLWPRLDGKFAKKRAVVATLKELGKQIRSEGNITGHVCRVTGAQAMAVAGVDVWLIQAFCRWDSAVVLGYIRDAHLSSSAGISTLVSEGLKLAEVRGCVYERVLGKLPQELGAAAVDASIENAAARDVRASSGAGVANLAEQAVAEASALDGAGVLDRPTFVLNSVRGRTGVVHVARDLRSCWCGWSWAGDRAARAIFARPAD